MVLYVESLRANVLNFVSVVTVLVRVLDAAGIEHKGFGESMEACKVNLVVLDGLLAVGITELEVPEKTG